MHRLWNICEYSKQSVEIYDFELERCVQRSIGANYHHEIPIFSRELFPMVQIAKDMIIYMCTNPTTQGLSTVECNEKWVPRFVDAIGWQLIDEENASAVPDFVENGDDSMKEDGPDKE